MAKSLLNNECFHTGNNPYMLEKETNHQGLGPGGWGNGNSMIEELFHDENHCTLNTQYPRIDNIAMELTLGLLLFTWKLETGVCFGIFYFCGTFFI